MQNTTQECEQSIFRHDCIYLFISDYGVHSFNLCLGTHSCWIRPCYEFFQRAFASRILHVSYGHVEVFNLAFKPYGACHMIRINFSIIVNNIWAIKFFVLSHVTYQDVGGQHHTYQGSSITHVVMVPHNWIILWFFMICVTMLNRTTIKQLNDGLLP